MAKAAVIAALAVDLTANTAKFNKALGKSTKKSKSWAASTTKVVKGVASSFAAGSVAVVGALTAIYSSQSKVITELSRMAETVNSSVADLSVWQHAGKKVNIEAEKMADIFKDVSDKIGDLSVTGGGAAIDMFEKFNLKIGDFVGLSAPEQIEKIGVALDGVASQSEKIFFLEALAGDASRLLPLLDNGAEKLKEAAREAELFGIKLSAIDAAKVEMASDATSKIGDMFEGLQKQITVKFSPVVQAVAKMFTNIADKAGGMGNVADMVFKGMVKAIGFTLDALNGIKVVYLGLKAAALNLGAATAGVFSSIPNFVADALNLATKPIKVFIGGTLSLIEKIASSLSKLGGVTGAIADDVLAGISGAQKSIDNALTFTPDGILESIKKVKDSAKSATIELNTALAARPPSEGFQEWVNTVVAISEEGAAKIAANSPTEALNNANQGPQLSDKLQKDYESVLSFLGQREMAETNAYIRRQEIINEYFDTLEIPNEEARKERLQQLEIDHQNKLIQAKAKGIHTHGKLIADFNSWEIKTTTEKANMVIGITKSLAGTMGNESKKAFKVLKIARIAEAIMNTYAGINQALATLPPPASFVAAGIIGAMGIANVQKIKKQQFRSSSAAASVVPISGGDSFKSSNTPSVPNVEDQAAAANSNSEENANIGRNITYNINNPQGNDGQKLGEEIRQFIEDGGEIIPTGSRQEEQILQGAA